MGARKTTCDLICLSCLLRKGLNGQKDQRYLRGFYVHDESLLLWALTPEPSMQQHLPPYEINSCVRTFASTLVGESWSWLDEQQDDSGFFVFYDWVLLSHLIVIAVAALDRQYRVYVLNSVDDLAVIIVV